LSLRSRHSFFTLNGFYRLWCLSTSRPSGTSRARGALRLVRFYWQTNVPLGWRFVIITGKFRT
jgi:hypothetical protein